jgi:hypothetical protein
MLRWDIGTGVLATLYAMGLHRFQRAAPQLHQRWLWAEVVGGVMVVVGMAAVAARCGEVSSWQAYERLVTRLFVAAGIPIVVWQMFWSDR